MCYLDYTLYYACGCSEARRERINNCNGNCVGENIRYEESRDTELSEECPEHVAARQLQTPPTSSDSSAYMRISHHKH